MSCNHLPNVTCDWCQHLHVSRPAIYIANTDGTSPGVTMRPIHGFGMVSKQMPMTYDQAAWSAGWAEGYQAGMRFAAEANESEIERLKTDRDRLREQLSKVLGALSDAIDLCEEGWGMQGVNLDYDKRADSLCAAYANGLRALGLGSDDE